MDYKVIAKADVPPEETVINVRGMLYDLFKDLPFEQAICIKCKSWADLKDKKAMIAGVSVKLKKDHKVKLVSQKKEEPLSPQKQAAFERSPSPGIFKRVCYLYVWKEPHE